MGVFSRDSGHGQNLQICSFQYPNKEETVNMKLVFVCLLAVCTVACISGEDKVEPLPLECFYCNCPRGFEQLCGTDGRTYQNKCMMKCAKRNCPELTEDLSIKESLKNKAPCDEI